MIMHVPYKDFAKFMKSETELYAKVIKEIGLASQ